MTENTHKSLTADLPNSGERASFRQMTLVVLLSFLFGIAGSFFGSNFLFKTVPGSSVNNPGGVQSIKVNEESAVVDVTKRASPAVVSIIISKDLNKIPGYSTSPFDLGPFTLDPFYNSRGSTSDQPDIQEVGGGSGFIISKDGLIATNKHVVEDTAAQYTVLTNDGKKFDAKVLSRDPVNDLAIVKIEATDLPTLTLGDSSGIQSGQKVIAIGNALGEYNNTVTTGVVSGMGRTITAGSNSGSEQLEGVIQTDAAINPGNSGGPLLDIGGSVIGINTAIDSQGQLVGFAIPINDFKKDLESFNKFGRIVKPFLGIRYVLVNQTIKEENNLTVDYGALIVGGNSSSPAVVAGSAAAKAGLKAGDIVLEINGRRIDQNHSLASALKDYNPSDVVKMKVQSGTEIKEITVTLGESK
jgi:S1-C subfamily serine protease